MKKLIENWLSLHEDNTVRISNSHISIYAQIYRDAGDGVEYVEYVSIDVGCPCCEGTTRTYYTFDTIDFTNCVLSFEDSSGDTIYDYDTIDGKTTHRFKEELSEQEIIDFFDKDWDSKGAWSEGEGRAQTHYEIMKAGRTTIISIVTYGFDDFHQPKYFLINKG